MSAFIAVVAPAGQRDGGASAASYAPDRLCQVVTNGVTDGWMQARHYRIGPCTLAHQLLPAWRHDAFDAQPVAAAGGHIAIAGRFALHRRTALAEALALTAAEAEGMADSALVARAWERWGSDTPGRLHGDFAFAVWDNAARTLFLISGRMSAGPYYHIGPHGVVAALSLRHMMAMPMVPQRLDPRWLGGMLCEAAPFGTTPYRDVAQVPWATIVAIGPDGQPRTERYWAPDPARRLRFRHDDDYVEAARELLDRAIDETTRLADPLVAQLSSGLDSAAVVGTLRRRVTDRSITAYTVGSGAGETDGDGRLLDETALAARTAADWPEVTHRIIGRSDHDSLLYDPRMRFMLGGGPSRFPLGLEFAAALCAFPGTLGARAVLTGVGGNLTLSADAMQAIAQWVRQGRPDKALRTLLALRRHDPTWPGWGPMLRDRVLLPLLPASARQRLRAMVTRDHRPEWMREGLVNPDCAAAIDLDGLRFQTGFNRSHPRGVADTVQWRIMWFDWVANYLPRETEFIIQRYGLLHLNPLLDADLLSFCLAVPNDQFLRGGQTRWLARRVLADRLPAETVGRKLPTSQSGNPRARLTGRRDLLVAEVERLARSDVAAEILDIPRMRALAADFPETEEDWKRDRVPQHIRLNKLTRALHVGQFVRWVEGRND